MLAALPGQGLVGALCLSTLERYGDASCRMFDRTQLRKSTKILPGCSDLRLSGVPNNLHAVGNFAVWETTLFTGPK